jgi:hypothetical protein
MKTTIKVLFMVLVLSLFLTGCSWFQKSEKDSFIEATVKATCHIFQSPDVFDPKVDEEAKAIYKDYGFDVTDEVKMKAIAQKYSTDEASKTLIQEGIKKECGSSLPAGMFDQPAAPAADTTIPAADATTPPVVETPVK